MKDEKEIINNSRASSFNSGFTLLELLVVLFIISILIAAVFPSLHIIEGGGLASDARRIASVLRYLNDNSVATKETCTLKVDFRESALSWKGPDFEKTEKFKSLVSVELQSKGEIREGEVLLFFTPLGAQEGIAINLKDGEKTMSIIFNPLRGRVKIKV